MKTPSEEDIRLLADKIEEKLTFVVYERLPGLLVEAVKLAAVTAATSGSGPVAAIAARGGRGAKAARAGLKALKVAKAKVATNLVAKRVTQAGQSVAQTRSTRAAEQAIRRVLPPDRIRAIADRTAVLVMPMMANASEAGKDREFRRALAQALSEAGVANAIAKELTERFTKRLGKAVPQRVRDALEKALRQE
ncbi:MAG: hypothetical protein OXG67_10605 [bacterium]|nr:hypothetical protein [bacterium]MCY3888284.1 hypothetical protein [bacterium]